MKRRSLVLWLVALVTLGSGLVNLHSVIGPSLPERREILREVFPLEFLHLSRFLTLLIGFVLVISSINIYKRKQRAFQMVLALAAASVVFHLTKGLDYEEALCSAALLGLLFWRRKDFTVKSSLPDWRGALVRLAVAVGVALGYGVGGFWLLDPEEFGIDFTWSDALHRTLLFLSLTGDPTIVPQTRYAYWFLESLYLMTLTAFGYGLVALFRPVVYEYRTLPRERALAGEIVARHGRSSLDFFKLWPDKSYFFSGTQKTFLAYRVENNFAVVLADPLGPEEEIKDIVRDFAALCRDNDWGLGFHQTLPDFLPLYARAGFRRLKIGDDAIVDLAGFTLDGKARKHVRNRINQLEKAGLELRRYEPPLADDLLAQLQKVSDEWLEIPGRRERGFTLGRFEAEYVRSTPVYAACEPDGRVLAFINLIPAYRRGDATNDLMRRRSQAPDGIMDFLFVKVFFALRERGFERFNLGMAPMAGFQEREEATKEERAIHYFFQHLNFIFSFAGLRAYKGKFATLWEPRYVVYRTPLDLPRLALALRRTAEPKV